MRVLLDSDWLFASFIKRDPNNNKAKKLFDFVVTQNPELIVLNLVLQETATVISHRIGQSESLEFLEKVETLKAHRIIVDQELEQKGWEIFKKQTKKGTSFVDCANLAAIELFKLDGILSFDRFYKDFIVST